VGKTTVARSLIEQLRRRGIPVAGFTTEELREEGRRVGFAVEAIEGERAVLAHAHLPGPPRVGRYGVDLAAFERVALPALSDPPTGAVVVIDELGKMELASAAFRQVVEALFDGDVPLAATVHAYRHPFTDALLGRPGVEIVPVTAATRDGLPDRLAERMAQA
jgi:nucleoside-triphosphatase